MGVCRLNFGLAPMLSQGPNPDYVVTGSTDPRANGNYFAAGTWEEEEVYKQEVGNLYLWLVDGAYWVLSEFVGDISNGNYWASEGPIVSVYDAFGEYSGGPSVAAFGA